MYRILLFILKQISKLPFGVLYAISDMLYYLLYYVIRYRRKVVRNNIAESFPEKSHAEVVEIEKKFYRFFTDMIFEACKLCTISAEEIKRRAVFKNMDMINSVLESGNSVAVYIGHIANWEWISSMGLWLTDKGEGVQIYHRISNDFVGEYMVKLRERFGNVSVTRHDTVRYISQAVRDGKAMAIGFIADQSPKRREAKHFLHFLNHEVPVVTGTEKLAKHYGFEILYMAARRVKRGYYEYELIPLCPDPASLPDFEVTRLYFERLEQEIQQHPEHYLWSHNRFKYAK